MANEKIYALFRTVDDAERGIGALMDHGVEKSDIGVITRRPGELGAELRGRATYIGSYDATDDTIETVDYADRSSTLTPVVPASSIAPTNDIGAADNVETVGKEGITTTTAGDAGAGAAIGGGVGLIGGILASAAALTIPGVGIVLAAGAVAAAIGATAAATAAGAVAGGAAGYLCDLGVNEAAATSYADRLTQGDFLVIVNIDTRDYEELRRILYKYNAVGIDINVNNTGETIRRVWGNDPVVIESLSRPPLDTETTAPEPQAAGVS
jgi:hypothetical protein